MLDLLVNISIVQQVLPVAKGFNGNKFKQYIREAQDLDLKSFMCDAFYYDLVINHETDIYQTLLKGGEYIYEDETYHFQGIETVLSYFSFARYAMDSPVVSTSHGRVIKETNYSSPADLSQRKDDYHRYRSDAECYWKDVKIFLDRNTETYTKWECDDCNNSKKKTINIRVLK